MRKNLGEGSYVFPMPVFIIGTYDESGVPDAMNAGWGGITGREEITLAISSAHKTAKNIQKKKAFTVSIGTTEHVVSCDYVGLVSANDVPDKLETAGFHTFKSEMVDAPLIEELPFALECELIEYNPENNKLRARIVNICADEEILDENGNIDTENVPDPFFDPLKTSITMVLTPYDDGTGTEPTPYEVELKVVGVMKEDQGKGYETSDGVMMDINALKALIQDLTGKTDTKFEYSSINVKAESLDAVSDVEQSIKDLGYSTYSMQSMRDELNKQTRQIELMLGGLGAISLLVAAIGITNTMIMSISERTKEIGIMKALGCYVRDIRAMFLMEAGSIGLLGGILGLIFSFIISVIINLFSFGAFGGGGVTWELIKQALIGGEGVVRTSVIKPELVIFALVFSVLVGLVSGYQPANKAVKISALEAIRNE